MPSGNAISRLVVLALLSLASISTVAAQAFGPIFKLRINYQDGAGPYENHHVTPPALCTDRNAEIYCIYANEANAPKKDGQFYLTYGALKFKNRDNTGKYLISSYEILENTNLFIYKGAGPINGTLAFTAGTEQLYSPLPGLGARSWSLCIGGYTAKNLVVSHGTPYGPKYPCDKITLTKVPV